MKKAISLTTITMRLLALLLCMVTTVPQMMAQSYTVAGDHTAFLGTSWNVAQSAGNDMTFYGNDYYYLKKTGNASTGWFQFKVALNHAWTTSYPSGSYTSTNYHNNNTYNDNYWYECPVSGNATVFYVFNSSTKKVSVTGPFKVLTVAGSQSELLGASWSGSTHANDMTSSDGIVYTLSFSNVHLTAGNYECKVVSDESLWYPANNYSYSINNTGTYDITFTFNAVTEALSVSAIEQAANTFDIYVRYTGNTSLANVYLYAWDSSGVLSEAWGGTKFSNLGTVEINGYTYYHVQYSSHDASIGVIFNENASGSTQTADLTASPGDNYFTYGGGSTISGPNPQADPRQGYYILGDSELGLQWGDTPTGTAMTYDSATGRYSYTANVTVAGTYHFVFADGLNADWNVFNSTYRIGPQSGDQNVIVNDDWTTTQKAGGDNGAYGITVGTGTYVFTYDPATSKFQVTGIKPILLTGSNGLGLGWTYEPNVQMTYNQSTGIYSYSYNVAKQGTYNFVFAVGRATGIDNEGDAWNTFNYWYRIGPDSNSTGDEQYVIYTENDYWMGTQMARLGENDEPYSYSVKLPAGVVTIYYNDQTKQFMIQSNGELAPDLYMMGGMTCDSIIHEYRPDDGVLMKYDKAKQLYYLNHVTLNTNSTFCFTTSLGESSDDWEGIGTRYGNADTSAADFVPKDGDATAHFKVTGDKINTNMSLDLWDEDKGEWHMYTADIYNVVLNLEDGWVKLIKTDNFSLFPMNVYLEQTPNVEINNIMDPGTTYAQSDFSGYWPLIAYNSLEGDWSPAANQNHYSVKFIGDTTTADEKTWWHWEVSASIAEVMFTRTNQEPYQSELIRRKAGVLWYTWEEDNTLTDHSRDYFTSSATALPGNVVVDEGHYYAYFINTVGWETVYCVAWNDTVASPLYDGHGNDVQTWPGQPMICIGIDPMTGYEVWEYDFGEIDHTIEPSDLLFHDGTPIATTDAKEQTGDFEFINGGVYDYLGMFDDAYSLNSLIRTAKEHVRYTISNDLLGVYYDDDAETPITYVMNNGTPTTVIVKGALYAKDFNEYGEKSIKPDGTTDYVYEICPNPATEGGSQVMNKSKEYDQSNWIKLVISPNYDGRNHQPVAHDQWPYLRNYVNRVIPGGTLDLYMTDSINPTARVMAITMGDEMEYEPNVYVSAHFNDSIVFHYTHQEWLPTMPDGSKPYKGTYRTRPTVTWHYNAEHEVTHGTVERVRVEEDPYMMFYVAPKPQEIAYITWIVYDNDNNDHAYGDYNNQVYSPTSSVAYTLPNDPGRFYAPMNWDRSVTINKQYYDSLLYLSENQLEDWLGGYGQKYGPYSNGYMQYGAVKVNWSLFGDSIHHVVREGNESFSWWQIFEPGQAYKLKALIRYARGNDEGYQNNEFYGPGNGTDGADETTLPMGAPRRIDDDDSHYRYANMYFTGDYSRQGLDASKFIIFPLEASPAGSNGDDLGNVTTVKEVVTARTVVSTRYYNLMGVGSDKPFDGLNIVVTTYSDGSRTSKKILR